MTAVTTINMIMTVTPMIIVTAHIIKIYKPLVKMSDAITSTAVLGRNIGNHCVKYRSFT